MREEQEAAEDEGWQGQGPWRSEEDERRTSTSGSGSSSKDWSSNARSGQSERGEESPWKWLGQPVGPMSIDEGKKQQALEACADLHGALVGCLKKGIFADCSEPQKAFWDCYASHRGIRGNKIAAWFAPPSSSSSRKSS
ncbi:unnamed protein product [Calypogeia fissa]